MASHDEIPSFFTDGEFLARAGKPRQRGSNEIMNALLQYFLHTVLAIHSSDDLAAIATKSNSKAGNDSAGAMPRQCWRSGTNQTLARTNGWRQTFKYSGEAGPSTIGRELISIPACIASSALKLRLHLPAGWPGKPDGQALLTAACEPTASI